MPNGAAPATAVSPRASFECAKAASAVETLICGDDKLAALDREIADRYARLHRDLTPDSFAGVRATQADWLKWLRATCSPGPSMPADDGGNCLSEALGDRAGALELPVRKIGGLSLEGRLRGRTGIGPSLLETDAYPWLTGSPEKKAAAFNRHVSQVMQLDATAKGLFAAAAIPLEPEVPGTSVYRRWYELHRVDDRLISLELYSYHEATAGHGWRTETALNWDLRHDRPVTMADLFAGSDWQQAVIDFVLADLRTEGDSAGAEGIIGTDDVNDPGSWLFDDEGAVLLLGRFERSLAGLSAEVPIPYAVLAPYLRPEAPLPARGRPPR